jgi:hypothetical protein
MVITARAIGVLEEILINPQHGAAKGLSARFGEGRDAIQSAISDLKKAGYLEVVTNKMANGKIVSTLRVTDTGNQFLETRTHILLSQLNHNNNLLLDINTDLLRYKQNSNAGALHGGNEMDWDDFAPMYVDPEDRDKVLAKKREQKHHEKMEQHERIRGERMKRREDNNRANWSPTDIAFEFGHRMQLLWHVAPWQVTRSRFRFALDKKRSEYNTTGDLECQMMDIYFDKIKHDRRINDPEIIWKKFIVDFGSLFLQVTRQSATPEQLETERERSQKSRGKLRVQE